MFFKFVHVLFVPESQDRKDIEITQLLTRITESIRELKIRIDILNNQAKGQ